jgi:hypothetical protein
MTKVKGLGKNKSIVAAARRLGELLWVLSRQGTYYEIRRFAGGSKDRENNAAASLAKEALAG